MPVLQSLSRVSNSKKNCLITIIDNNEKTRKHIEQDTYTYAESSMNVHWAQRMANEEVYIGILKLTDTKRYQRLQFTDHKWRHNDELAYNLLFW